MTGPDASVVVVSFNARELLRRCLETLAARAGGLDYELIVVDNASRDGSADMVAADFPDAVLVRSDLNLGFAAANNLAFERARGRYVILLNPDAFPEPDALQLSVAKMDADPSIGLGGARLVGEDGAWQPSARTFPNRRDECFRRAGLTARFPRSRLFAHVDRIWADHDEPAFVDWVPGAYSIVRREVLDEVGRFDERFYFYYEEVDLCRRIRNAGYRIAYWPDVVVVHLMGGSSPDGDACLAAPPESPQTLWHYRGKWLYCRKHHGAFGAWWALQVDLWWHRLRAWRNAFSGGAERRSKRDESRALQRRMLEAWRDTNAGITPPPTPW